MELLILGDVLCVNVLYAVDTHVQSLVVKEGLSLAPQLDTLLCDYDLDGVLCVHTLDRGVAWLVLAHESVQESHPLTYR